MKVQNLANNKLKTNHIIYLGYLNTVTVSPDGSLCVSRGKDGEAMLWHLNKSKHFCMLDDGDINALCSSPTTAGSVSPQAPISRSGTWKAR